MVVIVAEEGLSYFVAGLTNDDPQITAPVYQQYNYVQYNAIVPASAEVSVFFPPSADTFRYVLLQNQFDVYFPMCIAEVKVYLRGRYYVFVSS